MDPGVWGHGLQTLAYGVTGFEVKRYEGKAWGPHDSPQLCVAMLYSSDITALANFGCRRLRNSAVVVAGPVPA